MTATYAPGRGVLVNLHGQTVLLHEGMTIAALQRYVRELVAMYELKEVI